MSFGSIKDAILHIKTEYLTPENGIGFNLECLFKLEDGCSQTFLLYSSLERHCVQKHAVPSASVKRKLVHPTTITEAPLKRSKTQESALEPELALNAVESATQSLFTQLEAAGISQAQQTVVADGILKLISATGQYTAANVNLNPKIPLESVECSIKKVQENVKAFQSAHLRQNFYESLPNYVAPTEMAISLKTRTVYDRKEGIQKEILQQTSFQYISIKDTLKAFFKIPEFRQQWFEPTHVCQPGVYYDVCCAQNCQVNEFYQTNPNAGKAQLYYDECEPCDGLKSRRGVHKLALFYLKWCNIDPALRSRLNIAQLTAIALYEDIKHGKYIF